MDHRRRNWCFAHLVFEGATEVGNQCSNSDRRDQFRLEHEIAEAVVDSTVERGDQVSRKIASAGPEEVVVGNTPAGADRMFQKLAFGGKAQELQKLACAGPVKAAVGSTLETPVQRSQK